MNRCFQSFLTLAALAAFPAAALAAGDAHTDTQGAIATVKQGVATGVTALVVFAIVFAVLAVKVWPTITKALDERAAKIRDEIEAAEMARQQAKDALEQYQKSLADARAEAQKMIDSARQQQQVVAAQLKAQSDAELNAMREKARKDIESAKRAAIAEIYQESTNLATLMAGKILKRNLTAADTQGLIEESVQQLASAKN